MEVWWALQRIIYAYLCFIAGRNLTEYSENIVIYGLVIFLCVKIKFFMCFFMCFFSANPKC